MSKIAKKLKNLSNFVGNTPTIKISASIDGKKVSILAKYEAWNYSGSIKDRMAYQILKSSYEVGALKKDDVIVEATSGNTGIAFSAMGAYLGHKVEIYMPNWLSEERKKILRFHGAKLIEISPKDGGFLKCIELAAKKTRKKGYFGPKQFSNSWNVLAHLNNTAPELDMSLARNKTTHLAAFVAGMGTGGTIMGFHHYFSQKNKDFTAYPILPLKNEDGEHRIEGIGDSFIPKIVDLSVLGKTIRISDTDAIQIAQQLNKLGLSVGISSGANVFGAILKAEKLSGNKSVATILCDCNKKYLSTDLCSDIGEELSRDIKIIDYEFIP